MNQEDRELLERFTNKDWDRDKSEREYEKERSRERWEMIRNQEVHRKKIFEQEQEIRLLRKQLEEKDKQLSIKLARPPFLDLREIILENGLKRILPLPQRCLTITAQYLMEHKHASFSYYSYSGNTYSTIDQEEEDTSPPDRMADLIANIEIPVGYCGPINLTAASYNSNDWQEGASKRSRMVDILDYHGHIISDTYWTSDY